MRQDLRLPAISVLVPDCGPIGDVEKCVEKCLEGFLAQTLSHERFELILGHTDAADQEEYLRSRFAGELQLRFTSAAADLATSRNEAIRMARAPLVTLYSSELRPYPGLLDYCLSFHNRRPAVNHACLLGFAAEPAYRRLYPVPVPTLSGIQSWQGFQADAVTCKTALFRHGRFDASYGRMAGPEFALRLSRRVDLTLFYENVLTGERTGRIGLRAECDAHYLAAYYDCRLARAYPGAVSHSPSELIGDAVELSAMAAILKGVKSKRVSADSPRFKMLAALYSRIGEHARSEGWTAAQNGLTPNPPGSLGTLLK